MDELARLRPQLLGFAMRRLRNRELAEDAVQESLVAAMEGMDNFVAESSLKTWLIGILKHKIADCLRASARLEALEDQDTGVDEAGPEAKLAGRRILETLQRSLERLPVNAARAFVLREVMGMETREICRELAISSSNCWVMVHRARARLRDCPEMNRLVLET